MWEPEILPKLQIHFSSPRPIQLQKLFLFVAKEVHSCQKTKKNSTTLVDGSTHQKFLSPGSGLQNAKNSMFSFCNRRPILCKFFFLEIRYFRSRSWSITEYFFDCWPHLSVLEVWKNRNAEISVKSAKAKSCVFLNCSTDLIPNAIFFFLSEKNTLKEPSKPDQNSF